MQHLDSNGRLGDHFYVSTTDHFIAQHRQGSTDSLATSVQDIKIGIQRNSRMGTIFLQGRLLSLLAVGFDFGIND